MVKRFAPRSQGMGLRVCLQTQHHHARPLLLGLLQDHNSRASQLLRQAALPLEQSRTAIAKHPPPMLAPHFMPPGVWRYAAGQASKHRCRKMPAAQVNLSNDRAARILWMIRHYNLYRIACPLSHVPASDRRRSDSRRQLRGQRVQLGERKTGHESRRAPFAVWAYL